MSPLRPNNLASLYSSVPLSKNSYSVISAFCTEENISQCIIYINQVWGGGGWYHHDWIKPLFFLFFKLNAFRLHEQWQSVTMSCSLFAGACVTGSLFHLYWGQLTRGTCPECSASFECHVWTAADSQEEYVIIRGAGKGPAKEVQHLGAYSDEQLQTEGMYECGGLKLII